MKKLFIHAEVAVAACLLVTSCAKEGYSIIGQAPWQEGKAILSYTTQDNVQFKDTCIITNGSFNFIGSVSDVVRGKISFIREGETPANAYLFIENAPLTVVVNMDSCVDFTTDREIREVTVNGGPSNNLATEIAAIQSKMESDPKFAEMVAALNELNSDGYSDEKKDAFIQNYDSVYREFVDSIEVLSREKVLENKNAESAGYFFRRYFDGVELEEYESSFNTLSEKVRNCYLSEPVRKEIEAMMATAPGAVPPDFTLKTRTGEDISLASFLGKYVIVDFWASWCGPCRAGMPAMKEIYERYHNLGLEIIGVSTDHRPNDWTKALDDLDLPWVNVIDIVPEKNKPTVTATKYGVHYIPSYFLIDKDGKIIGKMEHDELEAELEKIFSL